METFLTDKNVRLLQRMFKTEDDWRFYVLTLWRLRDAAYNRAEKGGLKKDTEFYNVFALTNELIGALLRDDVRL